MSFDFPTPALVGETYETPAGAVYTCQDVANRVWHLVPKPALGASQITGLNAGTAIQSADTLAMVQGGQAVEQSAGALLAFAEANIGTAAFRELLDDPDAATMRATLGYPSSGLADNRLLRTDGTAGVYQESGITVDDSNNINGVNDVDAAGTVTSTSATFDISAAGRQLIVLDTTDPGSPTNIIWAQHDTKFIRIGSTAYETQFRGNVSFLGNTTLTTDALTANGAVTCLAGRASDRLDTVGDDATTGDISAPSAAFAFFVLEVGVGPRYAKFVCRTDATPSVEIIEQSSHNQFDVTTSDVNGATGTDGRVTLSVRNGVYEIENRLGFSTIVRTSVHLQS